MANPLNASSFGGSRLIARIPKLMMVRVLKTGTQNVANNTDTPVTFDVEDYDAYGMHDATDPSVLVIPSGGAGIWAAMAQVSWDTGATNNRYSYWLRNGAETLSPSVKFNALSGLSYPFVLPPVRLIDRDRLQLSVYTNGGACTINTGAAGASGQMSISLYRLGP